MTEPGCTGEGSLRPTEAADHLDVPSRSVSDLTNSGVLRAARSTDGGIAVAAADVEAARSA